MNLKTRNLLLLSALAGTATATSRVYMADITELSGSGVTGKAVVFSDSRTGTMVGYAGFATNLQANLLAATCNATNGCGAHVHSGTSCENMDAQEGHYFVDPITTDPWLDERYSSNAEGYGKYGGVVDIGTDDLVGRAFLIHAEDGSRVGCGLLTEVPQADLLSADLPALGDSGATGQVTTYAMDDMICFYGKGQGLSSNIVSFLDGGSDCNVANGCGAHVHAGTDCTNTDTQMGHYYNVDTLQSDPWALVGYLSTSDDGSAYFADCVSTGETEFEGKAFIIHEADGSRAACALLESCTECNEDSGGIYSRAGLYGSWLSILVVLHSIANLLRF